jgi:uncharacterized protein YndB with AHSA1/START domain
MAESSFTLSHRDGTFFRDGNSVGVRFERVLDHPVSAVWKALTEPEKMAAWLAPATIEGDTISLQMKGGKAGGRILRWEEGRVLEYEWNGGSVVRWELSVVDSGSCRLVFTHRHCVEAQLQGAATGWHYHMDVLEMTLAGGAPPADAPKRWEAISRDAAVRYVAQLALFLQRLTQIAMPR